MTIGKLLVTLVRAAPCVCGHGLTAGVRSEGKVRGGGSWVREGPESCLLCAPEMNSGLAAQCLALLGGEGGAQETTAPTAAAKALGLMLH